MRRKKTLIFGIACGVLCALCVALYGYGVQASADDARAEALARYGGEQVEVRVATRDIAAGEYLSDANSELRLWLSELLPADAVSSLGEVAGKPASSEILEGEVISRQRFDGGDTAALQVPTGMCAVSVPSEDVSAVGGSLTPGCFVDVYVTSGNTTDLLGDGVQVLATSASSSTLASGSGAGVSWVTLAVDPDEVKEYVSAAEHTNLYFVLANTSTAETESEASSDSGAASSSSTSSSSASSSSASSAKESSMGSSSSSSAKGSTTGSSPSSSSATESSTGSSSSSSTSASSSAKASSGGAS
jgi:pilus assembly protein CpaB